MSTNKHATIRYHALDICFGNSGRKYFMEDLIKACNHAIYEYSGIEDGVKRRQIFDDISFMESEQGWSIPLDRIKEGKRVFYRYSDRSFSIKNQGINQAEAEHLKETLSILSRFHGLPQFEWIEETQIRLESTFGLKRKMEATVAFEQNPYLKGLSNFKDLFNAIQNEVALKIKYQSYKQPKPIYTVIHPWYLKQYNSRWFLFGLNEEFHAITNLALDRIVEIEKSEIVYRENEKINFEEYFDDVIGVTVKGDAPTEKIIIGISNDLWPYIESKPLHGSQIIRKKTEINVVVELTLQINHELIALLFSYMDTIEVFEPENLRKIFKTIAQTLFQKYI